MGGEITSISMRKHERLPRAAPLPVEPVVPPKAAAPHGGKLLNLLQYPLLAGVGVAVIFDSGLGQLLIGFLGLLGVVFRIPSKLAFGTALFLLVTVPLFIALKRPGIANTLAVYVFELLAVGTVLAVLELRRDALQNIDPAARMA